jgi:hypothetical protein
MDIGPPVHEIEVTPAIVPIPTVLPFPMPQPTPQPAVPA